MMKTTKAKLATTAFIGISLYLFWKRNKQILLPFQSQKKKSINFKFSDIPENYKPHNSFIEFFDSKNIENAYSKYREYLDFGMDKDNAFKSVVENQINND